MNQKKMDLISKVSKINMALAAVARAQWQYIVASPKNEELYRHKLEIAYRLGILTLQELTKQEEPN
jgi:hypothetical protein